MSSPADTRVVIWSCDWAPYTLIRDAMAERFARFWPDAPWPISWAIEHDRTRAWGDFIIDVCGRFPEPVLVLWPDDFALTAPVDTGTLRRLRGVMDALGADYFRFQPTPACTEELLAGEYGPHRPGVMYSMSLHICAVRRDYLAAQARGCRTPWDMELHRPVAPIGKHFSVARANRPISHVEMCKKGVLTPDGIRILTEGAWPTS